MSSSFWDKVAALFYWWLITLPFVGLLYGLTGNVGLTSLLIVVWLGWGVWAVLAW